MDVFSNLRKSSERMNVNGSVDPTTNDKDNVSFQKIFLKSGV